MKKHYFKTLFFTLLVFTLSCSSTKISIEGSTFLWKVESEKNTVYLLGSIHLAKESIYPLDSVIEKAYTESDYLVVETDINNVDPMELMQKVMYQDDNTLEKNVSEATYGIFRELFEKHKLPPMVYGKLKPWAATMMAIALELKSAGFNEESGIDNYFIKKAGDKKPVLVLESLDEQLKMFDEFDKIADVYVEYSLAEMYQSVEQIEDLLAAWESGDIEAIERMLNEAVAEYPEFEQLMEKLLDKRNLKMVEKIKKYLETEENYFVVVGAGHLIGEKGIVNLLKQSNKYRIKRM